MPKKKKKPKACAAYVPSQWGEGQPVNLVTDAHTAEAPLEIAVPTAAGFGTSSPEPPAEEPDNPVSHAFLNVQVDSKLKEVGLYGTVCAHPRLRLRLLHPRQLRYRPRLLGWFRPGVPFLDGTGNGGHTGMGTENIEGLTTADCGGYLVDIISAATPGEEVTLTLWLGEAAFTPGS